MKAIPQAQKGFKESHDPLTNMNYLRTEREDTPPHQYQFRFADNYKNIQVTDRITRMFLFVIRDSRSTISKHNTITLCKHNTFYIKQQAVFNVSAMSVMFIYYT